MITDRFTFTSSKIGFPMLSRTTLRDDMFCIAYMRRTVPGGLWCEMSLEPGAVIAYSRSAEHTARNPVGTQFMFVITDQEQYEAHADVLGFRFDPPPRGEIKLLARTAKADLAGRTFETFANCASSGRTPPLHVTGAFMSAATSALSADRSTRRIGTTRAIDKRHIVHNCINFATSVQRIPSISELCLAAHVSERTLRDAFIAEYDVSPLRCFRAWAFGEAHRQLIHNESNSRTVTEMATGLGFVHLSRFAGSYRQLYGEPPAATLRAAH